MTPAISAIKFERCNSTPHEVRNLQRSLVNYLLIMAQALQSTVLHIPV